MDKLCTTKTILEYLLKAFKKSPSSQVFEILPHNLADYIRTQHLLNDCKLNYGEDNNYYFTSYFKVYNTEENIRKLEDYLTPIPWGGKSLTLTFKERK